MKLNITVNDRPRRVEIPGDIAPRESFTARIDDAPHDITLHAASSLNAFGQRAFLLSRANRVYECHVSKTPDGEYEVTVGADAYRVQVSDSRALPTGGAATGAAAGRARITAPMPGKIVRVMVEVGAHVEAGDGLVIVEAMKMQNEMKAPKSGIITELHATPGATVAAGDVLVVIE